MKEFGLERSGGHEILVELEKGRHLKLVAGTSRILMAFPFSAVATPYRVTRTNGQQYFANCAWDAVAFHPMLREKVRIDSFCYHCSESLRFDLGEPPGVPEGPDAPKVYIGIPAAQWWADIVQTCSNAMVFFASDSHLNDWRATKGAGTGQALSLDQTIRLSLPFYGGKMQLDYVRPSRDALTTHLASLGLKGEFWRL